MVIAVVHTVGRHVLLDDIAVDMPEDKPSSGRGGIRIESSHTGVPSGEPPVLDQVVFVPPRHIDPENGGVGVFTGIEGNGDRIASRFSRLLRLLR